MTTVEPVATARRGPALPRKAQLYILTVCLFAIGGCLAAGAAQQPTWSDLRIAIVLGVVASIAQLFVVKTPLNQSYHLTPGIILAAALLLPPWLIALVVVCQHGPEWVRARYPWFIQTFNIANFIVAALLARSLFDGIRKLDLGSGVDDDLRFFLAGVAAAALFVGVQHLLLSGVLALARGHSFAQSGLFSFTSLSMDFVLTVIGVVVAELWITNPALVVLALSPLFLVHRALAVPKLEAEVRQDTKTELYNARHLSEALDEELERALRLEQPLALLVADLDLLRNVNNRYGHLAGDAVLNEVATVLRANVRPGDVAARFGGEEFCLLLVDTGPEEAFEIAERIRREVEAARVAVDTASEPLGVTVSIGVAAFPDHARTSRELLHCADVAAYRAKAQGRNRVVAFGVGLDEPEVDVSGDFDDDDTLVVPRADVSPALAMLAAAPPAPNHLAPSRAVGWLVLAVALLGLTAGLAGVAFGAVDDALGLLLLVLVVGIAHATSSEAVDRGTISISAVGSLAGAAMFGVSAALPLAAAVCLAEILAGRKPSLQQTAFNGGALTLSGLAGALTFGQLPAEPWSFAFTSVIAGAVYFVVNVGLLSLIISVETHERWTRLLQERFTWLFGYYALYGVVGAMVAIAYEHEGVLGLLVFAAPLLLVRKAQTDYLRQAESSAAKLRAASSTIELQNETLRHANLLLRQRATDAMESLAAAIDARDTYTAGHSRRVQDIAVAISRELDLEPAEVEAISFSALFHDVGKLGVPDTILLKDGPLDDDDWGTIRRHPEEGARIIAHLGFLAESIPAIRHHHERYDGSGYPAGLRGTEIPISARILHVADAVDSMLSARPYRPALTLEYALAELEAGVSTQFCPECVGALSRIVATGGLRSILSDIARRSPDLPTPIA